jgi:nucleoside-diphosphate-sugar epimerase
VTGGAGFIGSHLCDALADLGTEVSVIDDLSAGSEQNLEQVQGRLRFVHGSILEPAVLADATAGAELIFHLAALTSVPASVEQPELYHRVNATGTLRVLEAARAAGANRLIFASSSSVYGDHGQAPLTESMLPSPASPYAAAKCAGEQMLCTYARCFGLSCISLRYFNIFGPRQSPDSPYAAVIPRFARAMLQGERPVIFGDGTQTRDFTHVTNTVRANLLAGACREKLCGQVVNIACGQSSNLRQLLETMANIIGVEPTYEAEPPRAGDILHSRASIETARRLLGYEPVVEIEEGLADAIVHYADLYGR